MNRLQYLVAQFGSREERRTALRLALAVADLPGDGWSQSGEQVMRAGFSPIVQLGDDPVFERARRAGGFSVVRAFEQRDSRDKVACTLGRYASAEDAQHFVQGSRRVDRAERRFQVTFEEELTDIDIPGVEASWVCERHLIGTEGPTLLRIIRASVGSCIFAVASSSTERPWAWEQLVELCQVQIAKIAAGSPQWARSGTSPGQPVEAEALRTRSGAWSGAFFSFVGFRQPRTRWLLAAVFSALIVGFGSYHLAQGNSSGNAIAGGSSSTPAFPATVASVGLTEVPGSFIMSPNGAYAYVSFSKESSTGVSQGGGIEVVDLARPAVIATIPISGQPNDVAISPDGADLYVARDCGSNGACPSSVVVVSTRLDKIVKTIKVGAGASTVNLSSDGRFAYVSAFGLDTVDLATGRIVDTTSALNEVDPQSVTLGPDGTTMYAVPGISGGKLSVDVFSLPTLRLLRSIPEPPNVYACQVTLSPNGATEYESFCSYPTTNTRPDLSLRVLDARTGRLRAEVNTGAGFGSALSGDGKTLYADDDDAGQIDVVNTSTNKLVGHIDVPGEQIGLPAVSNDGHYLCVLDSFGSTLDVIKLPSRQS